VSESNTFSDPHDRSRLFYNMSETMLVLLIYTKRYFMSVIQNIRDQIHRFQPGEPFTSSFFLKLGSRSAIDKAMSRLVEEQVIRRIARGVFFRPKKSRFIDNVTPEVSRVIEVIAKSHGEIIQLHGAEAARRFKISTQMPITPVYYTSGCSREIQIGKLKVKLMHTSSYRKLQLAGKKSGLALAALWYLGKKLIDVATIRVIHAGLSNEEFELLRSASMPGWMTMAIETYCQEELNA